MEPLFRFKLILSHFRPRRYLVPVALLAALLTALAGACYLPMGVGNLAGEVGRHVSQDPDSTDPDDGSGSGTVDDPDDPYVIKSSETLISLLQGDVDLTAHYELAADLDLTGVDWTPIGRGTDGFSGSFDGGGHTVSGLQVEVGDSKPQDEFGFFAVVAVGGLIENVGLEGAEFLDANNQRSEKGLLVGVNYGTIRNCFATGTIHGSYALGGLVGINDGGLIDQCYARVEVNGGDSIGGLVGVNRGGGQVVSSYAASVITATGDHGGFVGMNASDGKQNRVEKSYFDSEVSGTDTGVGGDNTNVEITALSSADAKILDNYTEFDLNVWTVDAALNKGYPHLIAVPPSR